MLKAKLKQALKISIFEKMGFGITEIGKWRRNQMISQFNLLRERATNTISR